MASIKTISTVASSILSRNLDKEDPIFAEKKTSLLKRPSKKSTKKKSKHINDYLQRKQIVHCKPDTTKQEIEKSLRTLATRGVVKLLNMIIKYNGNNQCNETGSSDKKKVLKKVKRDIRNKIANQNIVDSNNEANNNQVLQKSNRFDIVMRGLKGNNDEFNV
ncbi:uncharacterized protein CMU_001130 [Cryptosporidium muris RN66]|uniref:Uncharacterized protein n=1 Tax=Cryptosporidium muris (strain RN66) TaxID=441375 RepID=B6AGA1_CRYMR|nr:uncharacterized protein CMU_001130 [Cryptosporidium muris RN66]EEA07242.1 hypothetical protein, conserved [Cryptosporidium muris RN66]|eukprot:XP_002141591.1 hypothetical protein [Cryptosporidium muris RN66]